MPDRAAVRELVEESFSYDDRWDALRAKGWAIEHGLTIIFAKKGNLNLLIHYNMLDNKSHARAIVEVEAEEESLNRNAG